MSRGGANPNWEWQLVDRSGHTSDVGLRQRRMITHGHQGPKRDRAKIRKLGKEAGFSLADLKALFKSK